MADAASNTVDPPKNRSNKLQGAVLAVVSLAVLVFGLAKMWSGISDMMGWSGSAQFNAVLEASDAAYKEALKQAEVAQPLFTGLMEAIDAQPLADVRLEQGENGRQATEAFKLAAEQFDLAGKKIDEALTHDIGLSEDHVASLKLRSRGCALLADVCRQNAGICETALDESFTTTEPLVEKVLELAAKRDATQKEADAAIIESEELAKKVSPAA